MEKKQKVAARIGEIVRDNKREVRAQGKLCAYTFRGDAPHPAARQLRYGRKRDERDGGGSTWNAPHPIQPLPPLLLYGLPTSGPSARVFYIQPHAASSLADLRLRPVPHRGLLHVSFRCSLPWRRPGPSPFNVGSRVPLLPSSAFPVLSFLCSEVWIILPI